MKMSASVMLDGDLRMPFPIEATNIMIDDEMYDFLADALLEDPLISVNDDVDNEDSDRQQQQKDVSERFSNVTPISLLLSSNTQPLSCSVPEATQESTAVSPSCSSVSLSDSNGSFASSLSLAKASAYAINNGCQPPAFLPIAGVKAPDAPVAIKQSLVRAELVTLVPSESSSINSTKLCNRQPSEFTQTTHRFTVTNDVFKMPTQPQNTQVSSLVPENSFACNEHQQQTAEQRKLHRERFLRAVVVSAAEDKLNSAAAREQRQETSSSDVALLVTGGKRPDMTLEEQMALQRARNRVLARRTREKRKLALRDAKHQLLLVQRENEELKKLVQQHLPSPQTVLSECTAIEQIPGTVWADIRDMESADEDDKNNSGSSSSHKTSSNKKRSRRDSCFTSPVRSSVLVSDHSDRGSKLSSPSHKKPHRFFVDTVRRVADKAADSLMTFPACVDQGISSYLPVANIWSLSDEAIQAMFADSSTSTSAADGYDNEDDQGVHGNNQGVAARPLHHILTLPSSNPLWTCG